MMSPKIEIRIIAILIAILFIIIPVELAEGVKINLDSFEISAKIALSSSMFEGNDTPFHKTSYETRLIYLTYLSIVILTIILISVFILRKNRNILSLMGKRANPFIFPSETNTLFVLTIIFSILSIFLLSAPLSGPLTSLHTILFGKYYFVGIDKLKLIVLFFISLTFLIYVIKPYLIIKKEKLVELNIKFPEIGEEIRNLANSAGLERTFKLMYKPSPEIEIYTFGTHWQNFIVLSKGFLDKFKAKKAEFRAISSHELAHMINRDIGITEMSLSYLFSFFVFMTIFFLIHLTNIILHELHYGLGFWRREHLEQIGVFHPQSGYNPIRDPNILSDSIANLFCVLLIGLVLLYLVKSILRYRELYADARSVHILEDEKPLLKALYRVGLIQSFQKSKKYQRFISIPERRFRSSHPSKALREEYINNPLKFFEIGLSIPFVVGMMAYMIEHQLLILSTFTWAKSIDFLIFPFLVPIVPIILLLSIYLLMPKFSSSICIMPSSLLSKLEPFFISQSFVFGFLVSSIILDNLPMVIKGSIMRIMISSPVEVSYSYFGHHLPGYLPTMGLIRGELYGMTLLSILLLSKWIISQLLNCYSLKMIAKRPRLTLISIPSLLPIIMITPLFLKGWDITSIIMSSLGLLLLIVIPYTLTKKFKCCPICKNRIEESFKLGLTCTNCGYPVGGWLEGGG